MPRAPRDVSDATLRLILAEGIGPITAARLREHFGSDENIIVATISQLRNVHGIGSVTADSIRRALDAADPDAERTATEQHGTTMIVYGDSDYPPLLATIPDPPLALWIRGDLRPQDHVAIAIVGSRTCSAYGREQAARFTTLLAQSGLTIISGGAIGIDAEAHRAAVRVNARTIVVLGCGVGVTYPPDHKDLFNTIAASHGALISEFPTTMPPVAEHFPRRNRIISGLSLGVLVIEAGLRSGSLITARLAAEEHHREVMALPGRVDSPASAGSLRAIRDGWAALVVDHADVLLQLESSAGHLLRGAIETSRHDSQSSNPTAEHSAGQAPARKDARSASAGSTSLFDHALTPSQQAIMQAIAESGGEPVLSDVIAARTQLPMPQIMADLTLLQIRGRLTRSGGGSVRMRDRTVT